MSNALAIAHVTQALALLLENNLRPEIDIAVSVETRKPPAEPPPEPTINVFLYQVTPNPNMRNADLVTRASDGTLLKRAAAALDLHYVISAYGEENELVGQRLIGSVVRTLHEIPTLPHDIVEAAAELPFLHGSDLASSPQRVRFTPQVMDVDETSKLWGMLYQTPYTLSVVYTATLVLIDGREKPVPGKPVERSSIRVLPFGAPGAPVPPRIGDVPPGRRPAGVPGGSAAGSGDEAGGSAGSGGTAGGARQDAPSGPGGTTAAGGGDGSGEDAERPEAAAATKRTATKKTASRAGRSAKKAASGAEQGRGAATGQTGSGSGTGSGTAAAKKAVAKRSAAARSRRAQGPKSTDGGEN
ncbi:DUF4255 domain-containing protein [Streptomyces sp. TS71-3]|uniref:DUF4255 domain-containing protein n=1 Tax=Streptomyces sp. TS71-3 TaxID=2733862 RepID=UPI001B055A2F|nr:DUF4255 domain-containing protein [Streptomyces sp. TS71-3]GHJ35083.1 hypothetical protein Sm713_06920 [Streptomyces sp. TS71-3]